jgi:hypothetical protein
MRLAYYGEVSDAGIVAGGGAVALGGSNRRSLAPMTNMPGLSASCMAVCCSTALVC